MIREGSPDTHFTFRLVLDSSFLAQYFQVYAWNYCQNDVVYNGITLTLQKLVKKRTSTYDSNYFRRDENELILEMQKCSNLLL